VRREGGRARIAVFCTPEPGHFQMVRPLLAGLVRAGADVRAYTHRDFEPRVREAGAAFTDLFAAWPVERADARSTPVPCRYVSHAAAFAADIAQDIAGFGATLVVLESFSVAARVAAGMLGVPWVNLLPGHALVPARFLRRLATDPRVNLSPECENAVATLRDRGLLPDASPFSFVTSLSPFLNLSCEPEGFLDGEERRALEPLAFFGCLGEAPPARRARAVPRRIYASFGHIVWRYFRAEALACLRALSEFVGARPDLTALAGLGGAALAPAELRALAGPRMHVLDRADQLAALDEADVFVTHHGLNSTHEAIVRTVPMVSYPFFWDQPDLAARCQAMGLAVPLVEAPRAAPRPDDFAAALEALTRDAERRASRLRRARDEELEVIAGRDAVLERLLALAGR